MSDRIKRYEWEDALLEAERLGAIEPGAVNMCLRLAKAITWEPKEKHKPSGLYWKNETALQSVGSSKATYHRYREGLFSVGFFVEIKKNLIPQIPDLSQIETKQSQIETGKSQIETNESQIDNPYTVDICSGDSGSGDKSMPLGSASGSNSDPFESQSESLSTIDTSSESHTSEPLFIIEGDMETSCESVGDFRKSQIETNRVSSLGPPAYEPEVFPKSTSVMEYVRAQKESVAPSTKRLEAPVANEQRKDEESPTEEMPESQKPVEGSPRDTSGLSGWDMEPVEPKPKFELNAQLDEIEREQRENSKHKDLETVPPITEPDPRLAGW